MRRYNKNLGVADLFIQTLLYVPTMIFHLIGFIETEFLIISLMIQFPLGVYQVCSGLVGVARGRRWMNRYLTIVFFYFILGFVFYMIFEMMNPRMDSEMERYLGLFYGIVIPMIIGGYYYITCINEHNELKEQDTGKIKHAEYDSEILDADLTT